MNLAPYDGTPVAAFDRTRLWHYRARLSYIHDADTLTPVVDTGFSGRHEPHIRLADLFAPELTTAEGRKAAGALRAAMPAPSLSGWDVRVVTRQLPRETAEDMSFAR